jgi:hypothetical protein
MMIAEKIKSANAALGVLAGKVTEEQWGLIKCVRNELKDAQESAEHLEQAVPVMVIDAMTARLVRAKEKSNG